ncbi:MAG: tyrosine-type recombinase/integrase [Candidatus Helarchaeota archaeon]
MAHIEFHNKSSFRLVIQLKNGKRRYIGLRTDDWDSAVRIAVTYHKAELKGQSLSEVFWRGYLLFRNELSETTVDSYMLYWKKFMKRFGSRTPIENIKREDIVAWKKELKKTMNETSVSITLRSIQSIYSHLFRWKIIDHNIWKDLKGIIPKPRQRDEYLSEDECIKLINTAGDNQLNQGYIKLLLRTGMRRGELYNLKWSDIREHYIVLRGKTGERKFPLWPGVKEALDQIWRNIPEKRRGEWVYVNSHNYTKPSKPDYIGRMVKHYILKAGLSKTLTLHSLRHTFGTNMVRLIGIRKVQKLMGHSRIETTCRYENEGVTEIKEVKYI